MLKTKNRNSGGVKDMNRNINTLNIPVWDRVPRATCLPVPESFYSLR